MYMLSMTEKKTALTWPSEENKREMKSNNYTPSCAACRKMRMPQFKKTGK